MGAIAMAGAVFCFWRFASRRAAFTLLGLMLLGPLTYLVRDDQRPCDGRAWFCDFIPAAAETQAEAPEPPCPYDVALTTARIFTEPHVDAEVHRLVSTGVCQYEAILRIRAGWKPKFAPEFLVSEQGWLLRSRL
ncbi:conserved hypothetical protein [Cupriavidus necator]|uniref:Uncharacterized protein n=1 Tax=Cupriavidus necator TaxID=106590 RepID=A0A1K0J874_CUPNE|nr:conserved hypothetical protein [Cupriavidus necator]